ncbi:hypothetical protein VL762_11245 [Flavobacterium psychrophilum]|uniref:hypothetical protein n=1 Tax=Flavobacterium psychrophilum TaxID=96345 RepID=UPI002BFDF199|nr:hypothetical protein [Flavobacterium psychrophilum]
MNSKEQIVQTSPFVELLAVPTAQATNVSFDIIINEDITLQNYCEALIAKIFELPQSEYTAFINYQIYQVKESSIWLNKLEKLLANNEGLFTSKCAFTRISKLMNLIEQKRKELQSTSVKKTIKKTPKRLINAYTDNRYFAFIEVKNHIQTLQNFDEKLIYLTEEAFEYKQADKFSVNEKLQDYSEQCLLQIDHLQKIRKMRSECSREVTEEKPVNNVEINNFERIRINGPINIFANAFKQMMTEVKPNGKPYIGNKIVNVAHTLAQVFVDENGERISEFTLKTYLSQTRNDKDPNEDVKIKF